MSRRLAGRMSRLVAAGACLALLALASAVQAASTYPPGPGGAYPDTLTIINVQNPAATPHPAVGDLVLGVGGIVTGFAQQSAPFGFYIQMSSGLPYSGIGVFTGKDDHGPGTATNLQLGDSVVVYAKVKSFQGATVLGSTNGGNLISLSPGWCSASSRTATRCRRSTSAPPTSCGMIRPTRSAGRGSECWPASRVR